MSGCDNCGGDCDEHYNSHIEELKENMTVFTYNDMYKAFKHGREFELLENNNDLSDETEDKYLPFSEWLSRNIPNKL